MRAIIAGTGPSLTPDAINAINDSQVPVFGVNNTYQVLNLDVLLACNPEWWDYYYPRDTRLSQWCNRASAWTWDADTAKRYDIGHCVGSWGDGLATEPGRIHYGHSSGYQLINLAFSTFNITELILIGYDLRYPAGYNGATQDPGGPRHFFGEYPGPLQHWTRLNMGAGGELNGLLDCYRTIDPAQYGIQIINCSPGSALDFFETGNLYDYLA